MGSGRSNGVNKRSKSKRSKDTSDGQDEGVAPPSPKRWEEMITYKSFLVKDSFGSDVRFEKEQVALILPYGFDPLKEHDTVTYWVAKIKDIRADKFQDGSNSVWVKVQWYYSGKDMVDVVKSFNPKAVGKYERIFSDHHDCIQPEAFEAKIPMYRFHEEDHEQRYIPEESFYRRYTLEYRARNVKPKPGLMTCVCEDPYNPNDTDPLSLIHFCPRPSCRRGYHHRCLMAKKSKESSFATASQMTLTTKMPSFPNVNRVVEHDTIKVQRSARKQAVPPKNRLALRLRKNLDKEAQVIRVAFLSSPARETNEDSLDQPSTSTQSTSLTERSLRLLACSPDVDKTVDLDALIPEVSADMDERDASGESDTDSARPRKKHHGRSQRKVTQRKTKKSTSIRTLRKEKASLATILSTVPPDLLQVAIQPLVRGGAFRAGGVAGNIGMVTRARRLIYAALQMGGGPGSVPDNDWEDIVFGDDRTLIGCGLKNAIVRIEDRDGKERTLTPFVCLNCKSAI